MFQFKAPFIRDFQLPCLIPTGYYLQPRCLVVYQCVRSIVSWSMPSSPVIAVRFWRWSSRRVAQIAGPACTMAFRSRTMQVWMTLRQLLGGLDHIFFHILGNQWKSKYWEIEDYHTNWQQFFGGIQTTNQACWQSHDICGVAQDGRIRCQVLCPTAPRVGSTRTTIRPLRCLSLGQVDSYRKSPIYTVDGQNDDDIVTMMVFPKLRNN